MHSRTRENKNRKNKIKFIKMRCVHEIHKSNNDIIWTMSLLRYKFMNKFHILVGLISKGNERPRTREGNFPFTDRENAADRGVVAVKPAP